MIIVRIVIDLLMALGAFFAIAGVKGVIKMPDTFCRMQASTCVTTMGVIGVCLGAALYAAFVMHSGATAVKVLVILALVITVNPVGAHSIAKGAYRADYKLEREMEMDDFRRNFDD